MNHKLKGAILVRYYLVRVLERVDPSQAILIRNEYILHDNVTILHHPQPNLILDFGCSVTWCPFLHNKPTKYQSRETIHSFNINNDAPKGSLEIN